eukprot:TRINITY_DN21977_c0_g1_i1.p1 TRINITY_DN21977_c0_g1~~TRINITY_DN21977_c0_g1_i1.p1  ORF type:complete len:711 (+),score=126.23 TRINITY_DN21977_c0_g1_i1:133-2265(+)
MGCCLGKSTKDDESKEMHKKNKDSATEIVIVKKKSNEPLGLQFDSTSGNLKLSQAQGRIPKAHNLEQQVGKYLVRMNDVAVTKKSQLSQFKGLKKIKLEFSDKPLSDKTTISTPPIETVLRNEDKASSASPGGYQPPSPISTTVKQSVVLVASRIKNILTVPSDPQDPGIPIEPFRVTTPIVCDNDKSIKQQAAAHFNRSLKLYDNPKKSFKKESGSSHAVIDEIIQNVSWVDNQKDAPLELVRVLCEALSDVCDNDNGLSLSEMLIIALFVFNKEQLDYVLGFEGSNLSSNTPMLLTDTRWSATTSMLQAIASSPTTNPEPPTQLYINIPDPVQQLTEYWSTLRGRWITWTVPLTASMQIGSRGLILRVSNPGCIGVPLGSLTPRVLLPGYLPMLVTDTRSPSQGGGTLVVDLLASSDVSCESQNNKIRASLREGLERVLSGEERLSLAKYGSDKGATPSTSQNPPNLEDLLNSNKPLPDASSDTAMNEIDYRYLTLVAPAKPAVQGTYTIRKKLIENAPSWVSRCGQYMLQSRGGRWVVRNNDSSDDGNAIIASSNEHDGELPFSILSWHVSTSQGSWANDKSISVTLGDVDVSVKPSTVTKQRSVSWSKAKVSPGSPFDEPSVDPFTTPTLTTTAPADAAVPKFSTPTVATGPGWDIKQPADVVVKPKSQPKPSKPKSVVDLRVTRVGGEGSNYRVQQHGYWGRVKR